MEPMADVRIETGVGSAAPDEPVDEAETRARDQAHQRLKAKRKFQADVVAYVVINAFLVGVWAIAGSEGGFWPGWVMAGWGVLLVLQGYDAFFRRPITEADVDAELERQRRRP